MTGQTGMRGESTGMKSKTIALVGAIGVLAISTALLGMAPADPVPAAPELPEPKPAGSVTSVPLEALQPPQAGVRPPAPDTASMPPQPVTEPADHATTPGQPPPPTTPSHP